MCVPMCLQKRGAQVAAHRQDGQTDKWSQQQDSPLLRTGISQKRELSDLIKFYYFICEKTTSRIHK